MALECLKGITDTFLKDKNTYSVWIVANVADTVQDEESFIKHSDFSEFFTKAEFASIVNGISQTFGYIRIFYSELEFIRYVLGVVDHLDKRHTIIYNFARDGIREGKKSLIPAFCDLVGLNYTSSNPFVISLLRNKFVYTKYLEAMKIPVPATSVYNFGEPFCSTIFNIAHPIIAKNLFESASIGLSEANIIYNWSRKNVREILDGLCNAMGVKQLLVQQYVDGMECEVFVVRYLENYYAFTPVAIMIDGSNILTSDISNYYKYSFSSLADLSGNKLCEDIMRTTEKAAKLLNIKNYARFDYRIDRTNSLQLIDIAGSPYLTRHSSITYLFEQIMNLHYSDIFSLIAALTTINQKM